MWKKTGDFIEVVRQKDWAKECSVEEDFWNHLTDWVGEQVFPEFLKQVVSQVDEITEINPDLSEPEILSLGTRHIVDFLDAHSASVRIYDPHTEQMLSYGSHPSDENARDTYIPLENSVAGEVVKTQRTYLVSNILQEDLYHDKDVVKRKGTYSVMAVPLGIPRFFPHERYTAGVIQIYFPEKDKNFTPLEIEVAELMAKRLSYVVARKKILAMYRLNEKKEAVVRNIFLKVGAGQGVKMKQVFNRVIPELADIINIQSCALFSVTDDLEHVLLEAGYPDYVGYHGIGKQFSIRSEPAFELILNRRDYDTESPYEVFTPSYLLVMDLEKSALVSRNVKSLASIQGINSILYVPLNIGEEITHFMTFDALEHRKGYSEEEIELFLFLGRELMKAQRMERLDDILHDFKNPAIATAGFARRLKKLLEQESLEKEGPTIKRYVDILLEETSRIQEMALSLYKVGIPQAVNLTEVLKKRFDINKEAIEEQRKQNVTLHEGPFEDPLYTQCYPLHLERILDNLLNNATNAIPLQGGTLAVRTYSKGDWACAEITNTGRISEEERLRLLEGEGRGRGIYITHRLIRMLNGRVEIRVVKQTTTLVVRLPIYQEGETSPKVS